MMNTTETTIERYAAHVEIDGVKTLIGYADSQSAAFSLGLVALQRNPNAKHMFVRLADATPYTACVLMTDGCVLTVGRYASIVEAETAARDFYKRQTWAIDWYVEVNHA